MWPKSFSHSNDLHIVRTPFFAVVAHRRICRRLDIFRIVNANFIFMLIERLQSCRGRNRRAAHRLVDVSQLHEMLTECDTLRWIVVIDGRAPC